MRHWSAAYIGKSFDELRSCWLLVCEVFSREKAIPLPTYDGYLGEAEKAELASLMKITTAAWPWRAVESGQEREFDLIILRRGRGEEHAGIVIGRGLMLHVVQSGSACIETYQGGAWKNRLAGFWRHEAMNA